MEKLFAKLGEVLRGGGTAVLVTVVASSGSTPRGAGARMLVTAGGRVAGTIGGGAVEHEAEVEAGQVLQSGRSATRHYTLRQNEVQDLGMVCGGEVEVRFRYVPPGDGAVLALTEAIAGLVCAGDTAWLIEEIGPGGTDAFGLYSEEGGFSGVALPAEAAATLHGQAVQIEQDGRLYFCEKLVDASVVYVFGGGHVSQALVPVLAAVDFRCVVLEDRAAFAKPELFPGAAGIKLIDTARVADFITVGPEDYVVIMTRGHKDDLAVQAQALRTPARYIGVIGSRCKTATVFAALREMGFTSADLERITTPIGLAIGAETPAEIAISVAAQMIQVRAQQRDI